MAACPYCKVYDRGMFSYDKAYCTSPSNPSNSKKGDETQNGVAWARCVDGEYQGLTFKECPHFKKRRKR